MTRTHFQSVLLSLLDLDLGGCKSFINSCQPKEFQALVDDLPGHAVS